MKQTCSNCTHWHFWFEGGVCEKFNTTSKSSDEPEEGSALFFDGNDEDAMFKTSPTFGCNQWLGVRNG